MNAYVLLRDFGGDYTNVTFVVDGAFKKALITGGSGSGWWYNYHAFNASDLSPGVQHTLEIVGGSQSLYLLDYLTYDHFVIPSPSATQSGAEVTQTSSVSPSGSTPKIIGAVCAGLVVLLALILGMWCCMRKKHKSIAGKLDRCSSHFPI